jgi:hypothetical protein
VSVSERLRSAFEREGFEEMIAVLHPDVVWLGYDVPVEERGMCSNREEVRSVFAWHRAQGHRAEPEIVAEATDKIVVEMHLAEPPPGEDLHQLLTVEGDSIVRIEDFRDRRGALQAGGFA